MVLLMVVTIAYLPLVLPLLLPGVQVDPWAIAQSLFVTASEYFTTAPSLGLS